MRIQKATTGPFFEKPRYSESEFETISEEELKKVDLFPREPGPIRIDRFVEKRFGLSHQYESLADGVLGYTTFGPGGVESVIVARQLEDDRSEVAQRRVKTTLAHESGHGILHTYLFGKMDTVQTMSLFDDSPDITPTRILCRNDAATAAAGVQARKYDGRWWEFQANRIMGAILIPKPLLMTCLGGLLVEQGTLGFRVLEEKNRPKAIQLVADVFALNPAVAKIRLGLVFPIGEENQLTL